MGVKDVALLVGVMMMMMLVRNMHAASDRVAHHEKYEITMTAQKRIFMQKLDHFGSNGTTFAQTYYVDDTYWEGARAGGPIFVLFGDNLPMMSMGHIQLLDESASQFKGLVMYIEHRFYGYSVPFGSIDLAMADPEVRRCLSTKQVLADFALIISSFKQNASAVHSPVIVLGGYYSGMLAAWFRLKFPDIAIGALASSSPLLVFDNNFRKDGYCEIVSKAFQDSNTKCYSDIKQSWAEIDRAASQPKGLETLSELFNTCQPLQSSLELKKVLAQNYIMSVQLSYFYLDRISRVCNNIGRYTGLRGVAAALINSLHLDCVDIPNFSGLGSPFDTYVNVSTPWGWQRCTELVLPISCENTTMLPSHRFNLTAYTEQCRATYGVSPDPHWIATHYQGQDVRATLKKSASNIIFSNGLRDPMSFGGILENVSDTILAIITKEGHQTEDFRLYDDKDPAWLKRQRKEELKVFGKWINNGGPKLMSGAGFLAILALFLL